MGDPLRSFQLMALAGAILAVGFGVPIGLLYLRIRHRSLFPHQSAWTVPWNGWAVFACFAAMFFIPPLMQLMLVKVGFFEALYGVDFPQPPMGPEHPTQEQTQAANLRNLWSGLLAAPISIALILAGLRFGTQASLSTIGLSIRRSRSNVVVAYLGWLILTPLTFLVFIGALLLAPNPQKHPLMDLGNHAGLRESIVFAIQVAVVIPFLEELLFRGILLPWTLQSRDSPGSAQWIVPPRQRPHVCYAIAFLFAIQSPMLVDAVQARRWNEVWSAAAPVLFLIALLPAYLLLPFNKKLRQRLHLSTPHLVQGWFANAVLFAAVHSAVWPSPIPLFVLALGMAWLAIRTRSLIPCYIVHGLFNAVAVVYLFLGGA